MKKEGLRNGKWKFPQLVFYVFLFFIVVLILQLAYLSLSPVVYGINMDDFAKQRNTVKKTLTATRGTIYDKDGNILALNVSSYTVIAYLDPSRSKNSSTPQHVEDVAMTAQKLAPILGMTEEYLVRLMSQDRYQVELGPGGRGITELKKDEIEALHLPGIAFEEDYKRYYPNGNFASYVIGYAKQYDKEVTVNGIKTLERVIVGELGIEAKYDSQLKGTNGSVTYQQDRNGYKIPDTKETRIDAHDGDNIYLTLDSNIQRFLEGAIKEAAETYEPEWMVVNVMEAKTGKILATSSSPSFDPNVKDITNYENPLVSYVYEPGSTMKIFSYMCAMEKGTYDGSATYQSGNIKIGEYTINDWDRAGWGTITYDKGFEYSSNVAVVNLLQKYINKNDLRECYEKYGFGKITGIEQSREQTGSIKFNYPVEVATAGFGQGITVTPVQMLQALTMIANDGKMLKPHVVDKIVDPNTGKTVYKSKVEKSKQLLKQSTVDKIKELMHNTVYGTDPGTTGYAYDIPGFDIIGKTGTAQIYNEKTGGYYEGKNEYIFSFAGMYPKDDPEIIIYAAMKRPKWGESKALSTTVVSVTKSIAKYRNMFTEATAQATTQLFEMPSYLSKNVVDVTAQLSSVGLVPVYLGTGDKVISQYPEKGTQLVTGDKVFLKTNKKDITIPDMTGWSRSDVKAFATLAGITCSFEGHGFVTGQSLAAGTPVNATTVLNLTLSDKYDFNALDTTQSQNGT